jgi:hypothetical protein
MRARCSRILRRNTLSRLKSSSWFIFEPRHAGLCRQGTSATPDCQGLVDELDRQYLRRSSGADDDGRADVRLRRFPRRLRRSIIYAEAASSFNRCMCRVTEARPIPVFAAISV